MLTPSEIVRSVYGVVRLARLDPIGIQWLDRSPEGCWRSFRVAILVLPLEILLTGFVLSYATEIESIGRILATGCLAYIVSWTVFPVLAHPLIKALGREARYGTMVTAINWSRVVIYAVAVPAAIVMLEGPLGLAVIIQLAFYVALIVYHWFIIKTALDIPGVQAAGLAVMEFILLLTVDEAAISMMTKGVAAAQ